MQGEVFGIGGKEVFLGIKESSEWWWWRNPTSCRAGQLESPQAWQVPGRLWDMSRLPPVGEEVLARLASCSPRSTDVNHHVVTSRRLQALDEM